MASRTCPPRCEERSQVRLCEALQCRHRHGDAAEERGRNNQTEERSQCHLDKGWLHSEPTEEIVWIVHASWSARRVLLAWPAAKYLEVIDRSMTSHLSWIAYIRYFSAAGIPVTAGK